MIRQLLDDPVVVLLPVEPVRDGAAADHGAGEAGVLDRLVVPREEQLDGLVPDLPGGGGKLSEGDSAVAPAADGLLDVALDPGRVVQGEGGGGGEPGGERPAAV